MNIDDVAHKLEHHEARKLHGPRLKDLLDNFGIELPPVDAAGRHDVAEVDAVFAAKSHQYPQQFTAAKQAEIRDLLTTMGRIAAPVSEPQKTTIQK
jgi:hypothetical protein